MEKPVHLAGVARETNDEIAAIVLHHLEQDFNRFPPVIARVLMSMDAGEEGDAALGDARGEFAETIPIPLFAGEGWGRGPNREISLSGKIRVRTSATVSRDRVGEGAPP